MKKSTSKDSTAPPSPTASSAASSVAPKPAAGAASKAAGGASPTAASTAAPKAGGGASPTAEPKAAGGAAPKAAGGASPTAASTAAPKAAGGAAPTAAAKAAGGAAPTAAAKAAGGAAPTAAAKAAAKAAGGAAANDASKPEPLLPSSSGAPPPEGPKRLLDPTCYCPVRRGGVDAERMRLLARPNARRLRVLWDEMGCSLPKDRRDKIKSALEEDYFLSPEQTEQYFQALNESSKRATGAPCMVARREQVDRQRELRQRQKWLVNFSAQVAYRMCDYIAKGHKEMLVSNRLRSIADVVLERVAEILGEPKPSRTHPGRLARFMVAISDRIAVWIENAVYRADAVEPRESSADHHIRLDTDKPLIC